MRTNTLFLMEGLAGSSQICGVMARKMRMVMSDDGVGLSGRQDTANLRTCGGQRIDSGKRQSCRNLSVRAWSERDCTRRMLGSVAPFYYSVLRIWCLSGQTGSFRPGTQAAHARQPMEAPL